MDNKRREFLKKTGLLGLTGLAGSLLGKTGLEKAAQASQFFSGTDLFSLPALPYAYNALEPYIDALTMEIHHNKHHKAYVDKLNAAASPSLNNQLDDAGKCGQIDENTPAVIRNNLGGHYNHSLFWTLMKPNRNGAPNLPAGQLAKAIDKQYGSFDNFKKEFSESSAKLFGSGWCWLIVTNGQLKITTTPNQDNPLMKVAAEPGKLVLGLDVWEHAYYLKHQNKRVDYISAWWNVVNWDKAEELYTK